MSPRIIEQLGETKIRLDGAQVVDREVDQGIPAGSCVRWRYGISLVPRFPRQLGAARDLHCGDAAAVTAPLISLQHRQRERLWVWDAWTAVGRQHHLDGEQLQPSNLQVPSGRSLTESSTALNRANI